MITCLRNAVVLLLPAAAVSCVGPQGAVATTADEGPEVAAALPPQPPVVVGDHDPHFVESTSTVSTSGPTSITRNILQDRRGRMWFATWEGIIGLDGATFTNYTNQRGLRRYHAFAAFEDRDGDLWFGTIGGGVYRYDGASFTNYTVRDGLANDRVGCITQDARGTIWIGTEDGVSCFDGAAFRSITSADGLADCDVNAIVEDAHGHMWIGARGTSYVYDGASFAPVTNQDGLTFQNVRTILEDRDGAIWLGGNDGLWRFDGEAWTQYSTSFTGYLHEARDGRIWVSAVDGADGYDMSLYVLDHTARPVDEAQLTTVLDVDGMVFGIMQDAAGDIWFGTQRGARRFDGQAFHSY